MTEHIVYVEVDIKGLKPIEEILTAALAAADKFIKKVETGRARSVETYADMKDLKEKIQNLSIKNN